MSENLAIHTEMAKSVVNYAASVINDKQTMTSLQIAEITGKSVAPLQGSGGQIQLSGRLATKPLGKVTSSGNMA